MHVPFASMPHSIKIDRFLLQEILKQHTLPRLLTSHQPGLWLNFVEKAVAFERQMAPLQGIQESEQAALDQPELWRGGGCIATLCSVEVILCPSDIG